MADPAHKTLRPRDRTDLSIRDSLINKNSSVHRGNATQDIGGMDSDAELV